MTKTYKRLPKDLSFCTPDEIRTLGCPSTTFSFKDRINELIEANDSSNFDLALASKLSRRTINRIRNGNTFRPTPRVILQLSAGLQLYPMDVEDLFFLAGYNLLADDMRIYRIAIWRILDEQDADCVDTLLEFISEHVHIKED